MSRTTRVGLLAGAAALTLTGVSNATPASEGTSNEELIKQLTARIAALEADRGQERLTEQRAAEIRSLVHDVLADADTRASLLQGGMTAGYDNGFVLSSTDGNWLLRTNFLMQQRFIWNNRSGDGVDGDVWGFENPRSKFILTGHVVNPDWFYRVDVNVGSATTDRTGKLNAYLGHDYGNGWRVLAGSMKLPLLREELVEAQYQLAVERSLFNYTFTGGYSDGLAVHYQGDDFRFMGMISDGANMGNTTWNAQTNEYALTGRVEFRVNGNWGQFEQFTSRPGDEQGLLIGGAVHYQKGDYGNTASEPETVILTGDVTAQFGGFNLFGAVVWSDIDPNINGVSDVNPWGFVIQGGVYVSDEVELFARYEYIDSDIDTVDEISLLTGGFNWYFHGQNAKWTTDIGYAFDNLPVGNALTGWQGDAPGEDGQWVIRSQWQLLF